MAARARSRLRSSCSRTTMPRRRGSCSTSACSADETLQVGGRAFLARHCEELEPARSFFVNLDAVGSPHLAMLEGEGPIWMEDYAGPWLREELVACAERLQMPLRRGYRARA